MALDPTGSLLMASIQSRMALVPAGSTAVQYQKAFADGLTSYLSSSMQITYTWVGAMPLSPPVPDPLVVFQAGVTWNPALFILTPSPVFATWAINLATCLTSAMIITPLDPTYLFTPPIAVPIPGINLTTLPILPILPPVPSSVPGVSMQNVCASIIASLLVAINPVPVYGTHATVSGIYLGTPGAIMTLIT